HTPDVDYVRSLGADRVIDTDRQPLDAQTGVFDVVIDAVGREVPEALFTALRRGGRLITLQEPPSQELADEYGITALFFVVTADQNSLARIADMIDNDRLKVGVAAMFPLAEGRAAYESGTVRRAHPGKTVLTVQDLPAAESSSSREA
ncbi:zinc-binding dehydrogenase, partial [Pseudonocardia alaniniphila]